MTTPTFRIEHVWAFIATDPGNGDEGIPAMMIGRTMCPLIGADESRLASLREMAQELVRMTGIKIRLVRFDSMVELGDVVLADDSAPRARCGFYVSQHPLPHGCICSADQAGGDDGDDPG